LGVRRNYGKLHLYKPEGSGVNIPWARGSCAVPLATNLSDRINWSSSMLKRGIGILTLIALAMVPLYAADGVDPDNLKKYGTGIIKDYSNMKEADDIEWAWIAPNLKLSECRFKFARLQNLTVFNDDGMEDVFQVGLPRTLEKLGPKADDAPVLHVESGIYWAERANRSKRWIPYAGGHLAQAGVGIELVFKNDKDEIVAKIRHSGREGDELSSAAEELAEDIAKFVHQN
jgi:hypothetical protein